MNKLLTSIVFVFVISLLLFAASSLLAADQTAPMYRFIVSMDHWDCDANRDLWDETEVKLNGKPIGRLNEGFHQLESLPVEKDEHIKLEMPACPNGKSCRPAHWISSFIHRWMEKGALIDWYEDGKQFEVHTVTWKDFMENGKYFRSMDKVTWVVDGKTIGKGMEFVNFIEPWKNKKDLVIQLLYPLDWNPPIAVDPENSLLSVDLLNDGKNARVYDIRKPKKQAPAPAK